MAVTEFQGHQVFQWLEAAMGTEKAAIMMDLLPPVGWGDLATRADLDGLRAEMRGEFAELRGDIHLELAKLLHKTWFGIVASQATLVGMVLAVVKLG